MQTLQLTSAIVGIEGPSSGKHIVVIEAGVMLKRPQTDRTKGFIDILYEGHNVAVFLQDLNERAVFVSED